MLGIAVSSRAVGVALIMSSYPILMRVRRRRDGHIDRWLTKVITAYSPVVSVLLVDRCHGARLLEPMIAEVEEALHGRRIPIANVSREEIAHALLAPRSTRRAVRQILADRFQLVASILGNSRLERSDRHRHWDPAILALGAALAFQRSSRCIP